MPEGIFCVEGRPVDNGNGARHCIKFKIRHPTDRRWGVSVHTVTIRSHELVERCLSVAIFHPQMLEMLDRRNIVQMITEILPVARLWLVLERSTCFRMPFDLTYDVGAVRQITDAILTAVERIIA